MMCILKFLHGRLLTMNSFVSQTLQIYLVFFVSQNGKNEDFLTEVTKKI